MLESLFPPGVATAHAAGDAPPEPLADIEQRIVKDAIEKRQRDFALGRTCARRALQRLGAPAVAIPAAANRAPVWPDDVVGSITHCDQFAAAAVGWRSEFAGLGLDAEPAAPPLEAGLVRLICTPAEAAALPGHPRLDGLDWLRLVFSAKEAVYKAVAPMSGVFLNFHDVEVDFDTERGVFRARLVRAPDPRLPDLGRLQGRFEIRDGLVLTGAALPV